MSKTNIYVLRLEGGRYYGKSDDVAKRFRQHLAGSGSAILELAVGHPAGHLASNSVAELFVCASRRKIDLAQTGQLCPYVSPDVFVVHCVGDHQQRDAIFSAALLLDFVSLLLGLQGILRAVEEIDVFVVLPSLVLEGQSQSLIVAVEL